MRPLYFALLALLGASAAQCAYFSTIQGNAANNSYTNSLTVPTTQATAAGNLLVMSVVGFGQTTGSIITVSGITDDGGNTWTRATQASQSAGAENVEVWYVLSSKANATSIKVVTTGGNPASVWAQFMEYHPPTAVTLDWINSASVTNGTTSMTAGVTTSGYDMVVTAGAFPGTVSIDSTPTFNLTIEPYPSNLNPYSSGTGVKTTRAMADAVAWTAGAYYPTWHFGTGGYVTMPTMVSVAFKSGASQTPPTYSISGGLGTSGAGATVSAGGSLTATADVSGNYTITGVVPSTYIVTPTKTGVQFGPTSKSVTVSTGNVAGVDFALATKYTIAGTVQYGAGATVKAGNATWGYVTTTADANGFYTTPPVYGGGDAVLDNYTVSATLNQSLPPASPGAAAVTPASQNVTIGSANATGINFTAGLAISGCGYDGWNFAVDRSTTCTIKTNKAATVSVTNGGSLGCGSNCTSTPYTTPTTAPPNVFAIAGCPGQPAGSIYTTRIDGLNVHASSATWLSTLNVLSAAHPIHFFDGWSHVLIDSTIPESTVYTYAYTPYLNSTPFPTTRLDARWPMQDGAYLGDSAVTDRHLWYVDTDTCTHYEIYNPNEITKHAGSAYIYGGSSYRNGANVTGANTIDAGGFTSALLLSARDVREGVKHSLRMTINNNSMRAAFTWPATATSYSTGCVDAVACPPLGIMVRLKSNIDITTYSALAQNILLGMKQYGIILADLSGGPGVDEVQVDSDTYDDADVRAALAEITNKNIALASNFEVVDVSALRIADNSSQVNQANINPLGVAGITPVTLPSISVSDGTTSATIPVVVTPVTIGFRFNNYAVQAGTMQSGYQLDWWVNGTTNQGVTWTLSSGPGTVTTSGLYTPPTTIASPTEAIMKGVSVVDATATATIVITVVPQGANPTNTLRVDSWGNGCAVGVNGCLDAFLSDQFLPKRSNSFGGAWTSADYVPWSTSIRDSWVWQTGLSDYGSDMNQGPYILPNGNYNVEIWCRGMDSNQSKFGSMSMADKSPNLQPGMSAWGANDELLIYRDCGLVDNIPEMGFKNARLYRYPAKFKYPVKVTNNLLFVTEYPQFDNFGGTTGTDTRANNPQMAAIAIYPDSTTAAGWIIDAWGATSAVTPGTQRKLRLVDQFTGRSPNKEAVTWTVVAGPGSVNGSGVYTAPSALTVSDVAVIDACSIAAPVVCGEITLPIQGTQHPAGIWQ